MMSGPVQFNTPPPPIMPNLSVPPPMAPPMGPPPTTSVPPPTQYFHQGFHNNRGGHRGFFQPFRPYPRPGPPGAGGLDEFDGKRLRKSVMRKTVDYNAAIIKMLEARVWQRDFRDRRALQPDVLYYPNMEPPSSYVDNPINAVVTRFVKTATNKMRCPIFCMAWTPEGRRLVTGASSGEFTLWNGLTFNFETILQAHDSPVRTMVWSHNDVWMVTGDHAGYVKYWQSNMNNVKMFQAHKEAIRGLSFSPTDQKFVTCSDDGTLRIWDFGRCFEERILRGHGADVKCVHWHPQKSLIISGSKDNQQPIKLWDPKSGSSMATLHAHKSTVMDIKWNNNGNWLVTASRDHLLKLFDIRNLSQEVQTFRGHKKEASSVAWHPFHEGLFCSGGSDGAILFWHVGADKEVGGIEQAHDSIVWTLAWHPMGHILCSGSNDHTSKFWTRNRPGDQMRDKYNLNTLPAGLAGMDDVDVDDSGIIPGMGPEDRVEQTDLSPTATPTIPGLDFEGVEDKNKAFQKKVPYSKPIPRNFMAQWNETGRNEDESESEEEDSAAASFDPSIAKMLAAFLEKTTVPGCIPVTDITPQAIIVYGKLLPVEEGDAFAVAIAAGSEALHDLISSGNIQELEDVMPYLDDRPEFEYGDDHMDIDHMPEVEMPAPLPSSIFAKKGGPVAQPVSKSRFSDIEPAQAAKVGEISAMGDQDMRTIMNFNSSFPFGSGDQDLRKDPNFAKNQHDEDLRILRDIDLREAMMNSQREQQGPFGPNDGPFGMAGLGDNQMGARDVDARQTPFSSEQGVWQQPSPQVWGAVDPIRPGLNNFGTRNFVSSGNFQNKPGNFPNNMNDSSGNNFGNDMAGHNFGRNMNPSSNFGNVNNDQGNFDSGHQRGPDFRDSDYRNDENQFDGSWSGPGNQGPHGARSGLNQGPRSMDPRQNMGPRQMGPNGPQMGQRPLGPHQQMGQRPQMGPHMNQRPMGPRGPPIGGSLMGPRGQQLGQRPPMGPGGPQIGPGGQQMGPGGQQMGGGLQMDPRRSQDPRGFPLDPRNSQMGQGPQGGSHQQMGSGPGGPPMGSRDLHLGTQGSQMNLNQQIEPGGPQGYAGLPMRGQGGSGGPPMGHDRGSHRGQGPMGPGNSGGQFLDPRTQQMNKGGSSMSHNQMGSGGMHMGPGNPHRGPMGPGGSQGNRGPPMGPGGHQMDHSQQNMGPGGPQMEPFSHMGPGSHQMDPNHMGSGSSQIGSKHVGPSGRQMDPNIQSGSDGSPIDMNQMMDDEETGSRQSGGFYRGRGFSRSRGGSRMRMRGSRSRGGWRGAN